MHSACCSSSGLIGTVNGSGSVSGLPDYIIVVRAKWVHGPYALQKGYQANIVPSVMVNDETAITKKC